MKTRFFSTIGMTKLVCFVLFAALSVLAMPLASDAQRGYTHTTKNASISAADTVTMLNVEGSVTTFEYNATETSGTTAGKVYLEGRFLSSWVKLDSITLADVATIQTLRTFITNTTYKDYRFVNTNTSSSTQTILAGYFRRPGVR